MADIQNIVAQRSTVNTPAIFSAATALVSNPARGGWAIQNLGTNTLYVLRGTGASTTVFHQVLKAASVNDDGTGGVMTETTGIVFTGPITIAGISPRYTVMEM